LNTGYHADFSVSRDGSLAFSPGGVQGLDRRLVVVDKQGRDSKWSPERAPFNWRIGASPDGRRVACTIPTVRGRWELWISERGASRARRLLPGPRAGFCEAQEYSPDGRQLAYNLGEWKNGWINSVCIQSADGESPPRPILVDSSAEYSQISWSHDSRTLVATRLRPSGIDLVRIPIPAPGEPPAQPLPLFTDQPGRRWRAVFSPAGPWVAYTSDESGRDEIYLARYRADGSVGPGLLVSPGGGFDPRWSRGGRTLFYESPLQRRVMSIAVEFEPTLRASSPVERWNLDEHRVIDTNGAPYDLLPGDEMVAIQMGEREGPATRVDVVLNFLEEMREKLRVAGTR